MGRFLFKVLLSLSCKNCNRESHLLSRRVGSLLPGCTPLLPRQKTLNPKALSLVLDFKGYFGVANDHVTTEARHRVTSTAGPGDTLQVVFECRWMPGRVTKLAPNSHPAA